MTRKLVDCFTFYNELELLELRCEELYGIVNRHYLVESPSTFSGKDKPLYFQENASQFEKYPIIPLVVELPYQGQLRDDQPWRNDHSSRKLGFDRVAELLGNEDVVLISDVDEIPRPSKFKELDLDQPAIFAQEWYLYWLNCKTAWQQYGTTRVPFSSAKTDFYAAAMYRWAPKQNIIRDGGWHFSYFGGLGAIKEKISGVPDVSLRNTGENIEEAMLAGKGLEQFQGPVGFCEVDNTYPEVITKNLSNYQHLMHPDYRNTEEKRKFYESIEQRRQRRLLIPREIEPQRHKARMGEDPVYQKEYGS